VAASENDRAVIINETFPPSNLPRAGMYHIALSLGRGWATTALSSAVAVRVRGHYPALRNPRAELSRPAKSSQACYTLSVPQSFGLTGGIASGKSTVARLLEALGAEIIDADRLGHELLQPSNPVHTKMVSHFGRGILKPGGEIDRERLGAIVFAEPQRLIELDSIIHPSLIARVEERAKELRARDPRAVIFVDAALIYEAGVEDRFAKILVTWCRPEQQIERLMAKAGLSRQDALRRMASQIPVEEKRRRADYVIDCSGSLEETRGQVEILYPEIKRLAELETRNSKFEEQRK